MYVTINKIYFMSMKFGLTTSILLQYFEHKTLKIILTSKIRFNII